MNIILLVITLAASVATAQDYDEMDVTTAESPLRIYNIEFAAEEPGSGDAEPLPECKMSYRKYDKMYLRGVKAPNHIDFNGTSFEECEKLCCYETRFECRSFSYLEVLQQCFIMNVTQHFKKFDLVQTSGHVHVERVVPVTTTPETTTTKRPFPTPAYSTRRSGSSSDRPKSAGGNVGPSNPSGGSSNYIGGSDGSSEINDPDCPKECQNGGQCRIRRLYDGVARAEAFCRCPKGYNGDRCEKKISEAGFPTWLIAVIIFGSIILLLLLAVAIIYFVYWKKTGEYHVLKAIRKWAMRGRKSRSPGSQEDFIEPEESHLHTSPTTSVGSIHGSLTSAATHSTSTSV